MIKLSNYDELYVVERWFDGESFVVTKKEGDVYAQPEGLFERVPSALFGDLADCDFRFTGSLIEIDKMPIFFVEDVLYYNGKRFFSEGWNKRYKVLLNGFDWKTSIRRVNPIVVKNSVEMRKACRVFAKLPGSKGAFIYRYEGGLDSQGWVIGSEEVLE